MKRNEYRVWADALRDSYTYIDFEAAVRWATVYSRLTHRRYRVKQTRHEGRPVLQFGRPTWDATPIEPGGSADA